MQGMGDVSEDDPKWWECLVWFITGAFKYQCVCVVVTAPLQRHPTVQIFAAG